METPWQSLPIATAALKAKAAANARSISDAGAEIGAGVGDY
jgi:hypothetical protein